MESDKSISVPYDGNSKGIQKIRPLHGRTVGPARRSTKGQWTAEEDEILRKAVQRFKGKNWKKIAECFKDRTDVQCLHRWQKVLNPELVKGPWSKVEDEMIIELVNKYGPKKWSTIAQHLPGRIGKQCRERWHNHLNPSINKEAWTQEEELALIRAHQIYGNRWAELTKFLPGRTDNAIKNHWNSSVKKKLDSYLASGLLEQFQGPPCVAHQNQPVPSSSSRVQTSGDDTSLKCGTETEEISECSQGSIVKGCSQSASGLGNAVLHRREEFPLTEESPVKERSSSPASCSDQYFTSVGDITFTIPEIPSEVNCSSNFIPQNFSQNAITSRSCDYQYNLQELPNVTSTEPGQQSSGLPRHHTAANESHHLVDIPFQMSTGLSIPTSIGYLAESSARPNNVLTSEDGYCQYLFSEELNSGIFLSGNFTKGTNSVACIDSLKCQSSDIQIYETEKTQQSCSPLKSGVLATSCSQPYPTEPSLHSADDSTLICGREANQVIAHSFAAHEQQLITSAHDGFICNHGIPSPPCDGVTDIMDFQEPHYLKEPSKLVPVNSFTSGADAKETCNGTASSPCDSSTNDTDMQEPHYLKDSSKLVTMNSFASGTGAIESCPVVEITLMQTKQHEAGGLCYEPPCFPILDIPFLSCDLIQSGSDMQQEYSPLGIRQLMSSMNCITPFRLWDSPSRDDNPDAMLKSAAKTFSSTPSILKKRNRDLLSPLSDRRGDKKLEIDLASSLTKEFCRLDVMFDDSEMHRTSLQSPSSNQKGSHVPPDEDKENLDPSLEGRKEERNCSALADNKIFEKECNGSISQDNMKPGTVDGHVNASANTDARAQIVEQPSGVLIEDSMNDILFFSPDQVGLKADRAFAPSSRTPKNLYRKILGTLSEEATASERSCGNSCPNNGSPTNCKKNHEIAATSVQSLPSSAPLENTIDNTRIDAGTENLSIFGETPFKRSIESPSAWKSPWFYNSFLPGPRVNTEISIEDIGFFMSPGDRSYDAIALMKQLSEHTASTYADAFDVLRNETPERLLKNRCNDNHNIDQQDNNAPEDQLDNQSHLASKTECRTLDFSECKTPGKGTDEENLQLR